VIATHLFKTARKSVLPLWSQAAQAQRSAPDAHAPEPFVFLHGMLFTNIQLDDFSAALSQLLQCLSIEEPEEQEWTMMLQSTLVPSLSTVGHKACCDVSVLSGK